MSVLVTGGSGFIGGFLCRELYRKGWDVRILDIKNKTGDINFNAFKHIIGDILDYSKVLEAIAGVDLIIHLAAKHRFFGVSKDEFSRVNVEGTKNILKAMNQRGIKDIIFYSSVAVYGDQTAPTDEDTTPQPNTPYGITKLQAEKLISRWVSESTYRNALIIRPTVVFGPGNKGNMYRLIRQIDKGIYIPIGNGENIKSIAYVENLVDATIFLMNKGFKDMEVYNYADEPHISFKEIVELIYRFLERSTHRFYLPVKPILISMRPFEFLAKVSGTNFPITTAIIKMNKSTHHMADKIRKEGFRQKYSLEEGLKCMIELYKNNSGMKGIRGEMDE